MVKYSQYSFNLSSLTSYSLEIRFTTSIESPNTVIFSAPTPRKASKPKMHASYSA